MLINYRNEMLHDSSLDVFRDPVGAVTTGTPVTLRFRARLENVSSVYLCLFSERTFAKNIVMRQSGEYWQVNIKAPVCSRCLLVLFYGQYWRQNLLLRCPRQTHRRHRLCLQRPSALVSAYRL
ncbi:MAG: hypothetical protein M0C28_09240 [Candidatus Moduliflexus flocculans]|nr:hypothetical protein [Candidatus Moduliflexus flocculans]